MALRHKILLLSSNEDLLIRLESSLENEGLSTCTTWEPREALKLFRSAPFDLFVVVHHPPQVNAAEILQELQVAGTRVPGIIVQSTEGDAEYFCSLGASAIIKNLDVDSIKQAVQMSNPVRPQAFERSA